MGRFTNDNYDEQKLQQTGSFAIENELRKTIQRQKKTIFRLAERNRVWKTVSVVLAILLVIESLVLWVNSGDDTVNVPTAPNVVTEQQTINVPTTVPEIEVNEARIDEIMSQMTLVDKINQMMFVTPEILTGYDNVTAAGETTKYLLEEKMVGGILYGVSNFESSEQVSEMLKNTREYSRITPFLATAEEGGDMSELDIIKSEDSFRLPSASVIISYTSSDQMLSDYYRNAQFMYNLGFNTNFGPDVISGIATGSDINAVSIVAGCAVSGQSKHGISSMLKYFPTNGDSQKSLDELKQGEFVAYKSAVNAGADFVVMSNGLNSTLLSDGTPYCMSGSVITDMLRNELGFGGIVVSSAFTDEYIAEKYTTAEIAINCINAGNNMFLCPGNIDEVVSAIEEAVRVGDVEQSAVDNSVRKILAAKIKRGIIK